MGAWVGDDPQRVMVAQVSYGASPMCAIPEGAPMGHSTFRPLDNSRDQHDHSKSLDEPDIDLLHTLGVYRI